MDSKQAIN